MVRNYYGVITKTSKGYIIFNHKGELNLSEELKSFWQQDTPVHLEITNDTRSLLNESNCPIYYDRDKNRKYKLHINDRNIEEILEGSIGKQLYVMIETKVGGFGYGAEDKPEYICKS